MSDVITLPDLLEKACELGVALSNLPPLILSGLKLMQVAPVKLIYPSGDGLKQGIELFDLYERLGTRKISIEALRPMLRQMGGRLGRQLQTYEYALLTYSGAGTVYGGVRPVIKSANNLFIIEGYNVIGDKFAQVYDITPNGLIFRGTDYSSEFFLPSLFYGIAGGLHTAGAFDPVPNS